jgi:hypothetical protein
MQSKFPLPIEGTSACFGKHIGPALGSCAEVRFGLFIFMPGKGAGPAPLQGNK